MKKEKKEVFREKYRIPGHRGSSCHVEEDDKRIVLVSYDTKVAYCDKRSKRVYILGRYSRTTDRHCGMFLEHLHKRLNKSQLFVSFTWYDVDWRMEETN